jgi:signal transduction histidine kinase
VGDVTAARRGWLGRVFTGPRAPAAPSSRHGASPTRPAEPAGASRELQTYAGSLAHALRVPLSALSGEVELALLRERSPEAYREALTRIGARVGELIQVTGDLGFLGDPGHDRVLFAPHAHLAAVFAGLTRRLSAGSAAQLRIDTAGADVTVRSDEALLARALALLVEHALKHRRNEEIVRLRVRQSGGASVEVILDAPPSGFLRTGWSHLAAHADDGSDGIGLCPFGLLTASLMIRGCGASVDVAGVDDAAFVRIRLALAHDGGQ